MSFHDAMPWIVAVGELAALSFLALGLEETDGTKRSLIKGTWWTAVGIFAFGIFFVNVTN